MHTRSPLQAAYVRHFATRVQPDESLKALHATTKYRAQNTRLCLKFGIHSQKIVFRK